MEVNHTTPADRAAEQRNDRRSQPSGGLRDVCYAPKPPDALELLPLPPANRLRSVSRPANRHIVSPCRRKKRQWKHSGIAETKNIRRDDFGAWANAKPSVQSPPVKSV